MSDLLASTQAWGLILGVIAPLLISVVQRPTWTSATRSIVSVASAAVIGLLTVLANGSFNTADVLTTFAVVLVASHAAYEGFYKPTGISEKVEYATSPKQDEEFLSLEDDEEFLSLEDDEEFLSLED